MKLPKAQKTDLDRDDYVCNVIVRKRKLRYISSGAFASVYGRKDYNRVVKVGHGDDNYLEYVKLVGLRNPNIHLPTIYKVELFKVRNHWGDFDTYYSVEMERLIPYEKVGERKHKKAHTKFKQQLGIPYIEYMESPEDMYPSTKHGKQVQKILDRVFDRGSTDLHDGNIMWRKRGRGYELVITDPVS